MLYEVITHLNRSYYYGYFTIMWQILTKSKGVHSKPTTNTHRLLNLLVNIEAYGLTRGMSFILNKSYKH